MSNNNSIEKNSLLRPGALEDHLVLHYHGLEDFATAWHRGVGCDYLPDDHDREMLKWLKLFNPYDLYSKTPCRRDGRN